MIWSVYRHDLSTLGAPVWDYYQSDGNVPIGDAPRPVASSSSTRAIESALPALPSSAKAVGSGTSPRGRIARPFGSSAALGGVGDGAPRASIAGYLVFLLGGLLLWKLAAPDKR
jgi:hypothetical protein